jgi:hypothetical protein
MGLDRPICSGEYWWRQPEPVPLAALALLTLPSRISVAVSAGADSRRQSLSLALSQSETGLDHLVLRPLERRGDAAVTDLTRDVFILLLNTMVTLLKRHCPPRLSLGGAVPTRLNDEHGSIELPWQQFGFQLLGEATRGQRRVLARVRNLQLAGAAVPGSWPPPQLPWAEVQWQPLEAGAPGARAV